MPNAILDRTDYENISKPTKLKIFYHKFLNILARFMIHPGIRVALYRKMGMHVGQNVQIMLDCFLDDQFPELIELENGVAIGPRTMIMALDDSKWTVGKVTIKKGAYIGAGVIILPGVIIGENSGVGAGSVVTRDVPENTLVVGVPAKPIRQIVGHAYKGPSGGKRKQPWF